MAPAARAGCLRAHEQRRGRRGSSLALRLSRAQEADVERCRVTAADFDIALIRLEPVFLDFHAVWPFRQLDGQPIQTLRSFPALAVDQDRRVPWLDADGERAIRGSVGAAAWRTRAHAGTGSRLGWRTCLRRIRTGGASTYAPGPGLARLFWAGRSRRRRWPGLGDVACRKRLHRV